MFHGWCPGILVLVAVTSAISPTWADDLPPHFSALTLTPKQRKTLDQLRKDHSSLPPESISPKTELAFFNGCWKVLSEEQQAAWSAAARDELVLPKNWSELGLSDEQRDLLARPHAIYRPHIEGINQELKKILKSDDESKTKFSAAGTSDNFKEMQVTDGLAKRFGRAIESREVWEKAMESGMRGYLTAEQVFQLLVIEAKPLIPKKYAALRLTDYQLAKMSPKLKELVPKINAAKALISETDHKKNGLDDIEIEGFIDELELELSDALDEVLTAAQRAQLMKAKETR